MGRATWIISNVHSDRLYKALPEELKLLYFQLLTHPNGNKAGYFQIDIDIHRILRGGRTEDECRKELETDTSLWLYDRTNDIVLIPTFLKYNKIGSNKTLQSMKFELEQLPASPLCTEFIYRLNEYTEGKGLDYVPHKMVLQARSYMSEIKALNTLTAHDSIIIKLLDSIKNIT